MARTVAGENARINRRCADALDVFKATGSSCSGPAAHRAANACSHVRYGTKLDRHAAKILRACPLSGLSGPRRRRRRRR